MFGMLALAMMMKDDEGWNDHTNDLMDEHTNDDG
jgi:hypothetical protein